MQIPGTVVEQTVTFSGEYRRADPGSYGLAEGDLVRYPSGACYLVARDARRVNSRDGSDRWRVQLIQLGHGVIDDDGCDDVLELHRI